MKPCCSGHLSGWSQLFSPVMNLSRLHWCCLSTGGQPRGHDLRQSLCVFYRTTITTGPVGQHRSAAGLQTQMCVSWKRWVTELNECVCVTELNLECNPSDHPQATTMFLSKSQNDGESLARAFITYKRWRGSFDWLCRQKSADSAD